MTLRAEAGLVNGFGIYYTRSYDSVNGLSERCEAPASAQSGQAHRRRRRASIVGQTNHIPRNIIARRAPIIAPAKRFPAITTLTTNASREMESASGAIAAAISHDASWAKRDESRPRSAMR